MDKFTAQVRVLIFETSDFIVVLTDELDDFKVVGEFFLSQNRHQYASLAFEHKEKS
jgi:hypothetical protein